MREPDWLHRFTHCHWQMFSDNVVVHICVRRHWMPWRLSTTRINVALAPTNDDPIIQGQLDLDQIGALCKLPNLNEMRIFLMAEGNATVLM